MDESLQAILCQTAKTLTPVAQEEAAYQARLLACHVLGVSTKELPFCAALTFTPEQQQQLLALVERRLTGEPLQYILGEWEFMGLRFYVDKNVLIPRQDTETLCEHALLLSRKNGYKTALDMCCGSGCIGISLARLGGLDVTCADISANCLQMTAKNAALHGLTIDTVQSDLFAQIDARYDLIACNPPYLTDSDMQNLQTEVRFEPSLALHGGTDGLDFYRRIAQDCAPFLNPGGTLMLEVGIGQAEAVAAMFEPADPAAKYILNDICGVARVVCVTAPQS